MKTIRLLILIPFGIQGEIKLLYILSTESRHLGIFLEGHDSIV